MTNKYVQERLKAVNNNFHCVLCLGVLFMLWNMQKCVFRALWVKWPILVYRKYQPLQLLQLNCFKPISSARLETDRMWRGSWETLGGSETLSSGVGYRQENHRRVDSQLHQQTLFRRSRGICHAPLSSFLLCSVFLSQLSISLTCTSSTMCFYHCLSLSLSFTGLQTSHLSDSFSAVYSAILSGKDYLVKFKHPQW